MHQDKKISIKETRDSEVDESQCEFEEKPTKYRIYHENIWDKLLEGLKCKNCSKSSLVAKHLSERGFQCKIQLFCIACEAVNNECYSSPEERNSIDINERMTNAFLDMGAGYSGLEKFGTELNMNIISERTFTKYVDIAYNESKELQKEARKFTLQAVRKTHIEADPSLANEDILNIAVSYDGSWHTRGHSSNIGMGIVIDILTGFVLDYVILSKYCSLCTVMEKRLPNEHEFDDWVKIHKESGKCEANFTGSSGAMEAHAAEILWKRSVETCKMRYIVLLSDGDSKIFSHLRSLNVYPNFELQKQECVNHVGKRMYTALKKVVTNSSAKGIKLGGAKLGSLTEEIIRKFQGFYSSAIKKNAPDIEAMRKAIFATIYHCSSTDDKPHHENCPIGPKSWCFWQRSIAENKRPEKHSTMKLYLRPDVVQKILPEYERLSDPNLLQRCTEIGTQNANESLHNSIWIKCPKNKATTTKKVEVNQLIHSI